MVKNDEVKIKVTLTSKLPGILMNPISQELLEAPSDKDQTVEARAAKKVIKGPDGRIGLPVEYLRAVLIGAGRYVKNGKKQISTAAKTTISKFLFIEDEFLPFKNQKEKMVVDMRHGVLNNGSRPVIIPVIRPKFKNWEVDVNILVNTNICQTSVVRQIFQMAGLKIGVGDFRPGTKGPFGTFTVTGWEEVKD